MCRHQCRAAAPQWHECGELAPGGKHVRQEGEGLGEPERSEAGLRAVRTPAKPLGLREKSRPNRTMDRYRPRWMASTVRTMRSGRMREIYVSVFEMP